MQDPVQSCRRCSRLCFDQLTLLCEKCAPQRSLRARVPQPRPQIAQSVPVAAAPSAPVPTWNELSQVHGSTLYAELARLSEEQLA